MAQQPSKKHMQTRSQARVEHKTEEEKAKELEKQKEIEFAKANDYYGAVFEKVKNEICLRCYQYPLGFFSKRIVFWLSKSRICEWSYIIAAKYDKYFQIYKVESEDELKAIMKEHEVPPILRWRYGKGDNYLCGDIKGNLNSKQRKKVLKFFHERGDINLFIDDNGKITHVCNFKPVCNGCQKIDDNDTKWKPLTVTIDKIKQRKWYCINCYDNLDGSGEDDLESESQDGNNDSKNDSESQDEGNGNDNNEGSDDNSESQEDGSGDSESQDEDNEGSGNDNSEGNDDSDDGNEDGESEGGNDNSESQDGSGDSDGESQSDHDVEMK